MRWVPVSVEKKCAMTEGGASGRGSRCALIEPCSHADRATACGLFASPCRLTVQPVVASSRKTTNSARAARPGDVRSCATMRSQYQPTARGDTAPEGEG